MKKITMNDLVKLNKNDTDEVEVKGIDDKKLICKKSLNFEEAKDMVSYIADNAMKDCESEFDPFMRDVLERASLYKFYCGLDVDDLSKIYYVLSNEEQYARIVNRINYDQYDRLCSIADQIVKYRRDASIAVSSMKLTSALEKIENAVTEGQNIVKDMNPGELLKVFGSIFEPMDGVKDNS